MAAIHLSCDNDNDPEPVGSLSPIVDAALPAEGNVGTEISFEVSHAVFSGCGYYSSQKTTRTGKILNVTFYAQYCGDICSMNVPVLKTNYTFTPTTEGTYTFMFNGGEAGYVTKTILVNP